MTHPTLRNGRFVFEDWSIPDPDDEALADALHRLAHGARLSGPDGWIILAAAEAYLHLAGHPAPTANIVAQLRQVRAAVREARRIRRAGRRVPT